MVIYKTYFSTIFTIIYLRLLFSIYTLYIMSIYTLYIESIYTLYLVYVERYVKYLYIKRIIFSVKCSIYK